MNVGGQRHQITISLDGRGHQVAARPEGRVLSRMYLVQVGDHVMSSQYIPFII